MRRGEGGTAAEDWGGGSVTALCILSALSILLGPSLAHALDDWCMDRRIDRSMSEEREVRRRHQAIERAYLEDQLATIRGYNVDMQCEDRAVRG